MAEWSKGYLKVSYNNKGNLSVNNLTDDDGVTNPINGKVLLSCGLLRYTNHKLALTFIHEQVHSKDIISGIAGVLNIFKAVGHDAMEARAYLEESKWNGGYINQIGKDHINNSAWLLGTLSILFKIY